MIYRITNYAVGAAIGRPKTRNTQEFFAVCLLPFQSYLEKKHVLILQLRENCAILKVDKLCSKQRRNDGHFIKADTI